MGNLRFFFPFPIGMNRPVSAAVALTRKSVNDKIQLGEATATATVLTDKPTVFVAPSPAILAIKGATTEQYDANEDAATGSHTGKLAAGKNREDL